MRPRSESRIGRLGPVFAVTEGLRRRSNARIDPAHRATGNADTLCRPNEVSIPHKPPDVTGERALARAYIDSNLERPGQAGGLNGSALDPRTTYPSDRQPPLRASEAGANPAPNQAGAGSNETLLLADDEAAIRRPLQRILERVGYHVLTAQDGEAAVRLHEAHAEHIRLVIVDLLMPRLSGTEAYARMSAINPALSVIFFTGYTIHEVRQAALQYPGAQFLAKPCRRDALLAAVDRALSRS